MTPDQAREFVARNHRAVLITRRSAGGLQTSSVIVGIDSDARWSSGRRPPGPRPPCHPTATLCVFTDDFFGPWIQIEDVTEIVPLPAAMEGLIDYYRRISGEHPDWDDYRRAMVEREAAYHPAVNRQRRPRTHRLNDQAAPRHHRPPATMPPALFACSCAWALLRECSPTPERCPGSDR